MAKPLLGHAAAGETGKARYNKPGDQTNGEVCLRTWYIPAKKWGTVLRAKNPIQAEKIALCAEQACENPCIGYDQGDRNTLFEAVKNNGFKCDKNSLTKNVECDCSALARVCIHYAGIKTDNFVTKTQEAVVMKSGAFNRFTFKSEKDLKRGDILITKEVPGHTAIVLSDGAKVTVKAPDLSNKTIGKATATENLGTVIEKEPNPLDDLFEITYSVSGGESIYS